MHRKKLAILGDPGVGKTALLSPLVVGSPFNRSLRLLGIRISRRLQSVAIEDHREHLEWQIWELTGAPTLDGAQAMAFKQVSAAILVADGTDPLTIEHLTSHWLPTLRAASPAARISLLINKSDLPGFRMPTAAMTKGIPVTAVSNRDREGVITTLDSLARRVLMMDYLPDLPRPVARTLRPSASGA